MGGSLHDDTHTDASVAPLALCASAAAAQDLLLPVGEGDFNWDSYQEFADAHDFSRPDDNA